ncbi:MAG: D-glucuronyl C5-epimerase family protein [Ktedonobacteraceae bacterium]
MYDMYVKDSVAALPGTRQEGIAALAPYPPDMAVFLAPPRCAFNDEGVPYHLKPVGYHPSTIVYYALAQWNAYLITHEELHRQRFLAQAHWLVEQEVRTGADASGWPVSFPRPDSHVSGSWLSASAQGCALSVLVRAYQLTHEELFLEVAQRAMRSFERDILDGGVSAPVGEKGVFFEEVAVYPATHALSGCIFALIGLHEWQLYSGSPLAIEGLIARAVSTLRDLLAAFDAGFWTYTHLLHKPLASASDLALQIALLEALASYDGCEYCASVAARWRSYQTRAGSRLRYLVTSRAISARQALWGRVRAALFPAPQASPVTRVCVAVTAFPVTGGIRAVLAGVAHATRGAWQIEYLTQAVGANAQDYSIQQFGTKYMASSQFPGAWLYTMAGFWKLLSLMRHGAGYQVILPQDGVFTAAFSALAGRMLGIRVVCIDHGSLTLLDSPTYRAERVQALAAKPWSRPRYLLARLRYMAYWPSFSVAARIAVRLVDHLLIPGVAGDSVEESCQRLGIHPSRITRFGSMIDSERHSVPDVISRAALRAEKGIAADAIVIALTCRLAPEKGLDIALEALSLALAPLSSTQRARVRVVIAGDGPLRQQVAAAIVERGLGATCVLWGETTHEDVISLLGLSDIFLYTSRRGACLSMAVLEAMASACAVVATSEPLSNVHLLSAGRGIALPANDAQQLGQALTRLISDPVLCRQMGTTARNYVASYHSPTVFRRTLLRATYWSGLDELLSVTRQPAAVLR